MPGLDPGIHVFIQHATLGSFRRFHLAILGRRQGFGQKRVEQAATGSAVAVRLASSRSQSAISASTLATMRCCSARGGRELAFDEIRQ